MPEKSRSITKKDAALIEREYEDLLFYDYPILFTGISSKNDRILGSFVESKDGIESYLHSIVDEKTYIDFIHRKISYPEVLQQAYNLYLLHWTGKETPDVYWLNYEDIPEIYRPGQLAFCPEIPTSPSFDYEAKFEGGLADNHQATPETISKFQNKFAQLLRNPFGLRSLSDLISKVLLQADYSSEAYAPGSLKIKYHVELAERTPTFFYDPETYSRFLNSYIAYCLQNLSQDASGLVEESPEGSENFNRLIAEYDALVGQSNGSPEQRRKDIAQSVIDSAKKLNDITLIVKDEFKQVVLSNVQESSLVPLGVLDETFSREIEEAILEVETKTGKQTITDEDFNTYVIHIYDLNVDTRKGRALMTNPNDPKSLMKPTFRISGTEVLSQTKYTESLHFDKFIEVRGRATKTDSIVKYIEIEFEP